MVLIDFDYIPNEVAEAILDEFDKQTHSYNPRELMKTFMKYQLKEHVENIQSFKLTDGKINTTLNQYFINSKRNEDLSRTNLEEFFS